MTPEEITAAAKAEIDALRAKHKSWRDVKQHATSLSSAGSALASVLKRSEMKTSVDTYAAASKRAEGAQRTQRGMGAYAATAGFAATIASGSLLFLQLAQGTWPSLVLNIAHAASLAFALLAAFFLYASKPGAAWAKARLTSEGLRLNHFQSILYAADPAHGSIPFRPLAVEYVRAYLIEDQCDWHKNRSRDHYWSRIWIAALRVLGILFLAVAMTPVAADAAIFLKDAAPKIAQWAASAKLWVTIDRAALAGVIGGALQTFVANLSALSLAERNRRSFQNVVTRMTEYLGAPLTRARHAAAIGDDVGVERYWSTVRTELVVETRAWAEALGMSTTIALDGLTAAQRDSRPANGAT